MVCLDAGMPDLVKQTNSLIQTERGDRRDWVRGDLVPAAALEGMETTAIINST